MGSGIASYDSARWKGGVQDITHVQSLAGMATLHQVRGQHVEPLIEIVVPPMPAAVLLLRRDHAGKPAVRFGGKIHENSYRSGDFSLIGAHTDSWWALDERAAGGWFHVHFDAAQLAQAEQAHGLPLGTIPQFSDPQLMQMVGVVRDIAGEPEPPNPMVWEALSQVMLWRMTRIVHGSKTRLPRQGGLAAWQARRTTEFIADNLDRRISLHELAAIARLSPFHFARAFARTVGMPPYRFQQKLRLEKTCELLASTRMSVLEVALCVGYESPQALARVFQRHHGLTPSQWRQRNGRGA